MSTIRALAGAVVLACLGAAGVGAQTEAASFADCAEHLRAAPRDPTAARCFLEATQRGGDVREAARLLAEHAEAHPDLAWPRYLVGYLANDGPTAFASLRRARDLFTAQHDDAAAFMAQRELIRKLVFWGRLDEAATELERLRAMRPEDDAYADARIALSEAGLAIKRGDLDYAYARLTEVKGRLIPGGPDELREELLYRLGVVLYELGQTREAGESIERSADISRARGDRYHEAASLFMSAAWIGEEAGEEDRELVAEHYRKALAVAEAVGRFSIVANAHIQLAKLATEPEDARRHLDACLGLARELDALTRSLCLGAHAYELMAGHTAAADPTTARQVMDEALAIARDSESPWSMVYLWSDRLPVSWSTLERPAALVESLATLDDIEKLRDDHLDDDASAKYFSVWAPAYGWLAGRLLDTSGPPIARQDIEQAFAVTERYRARVLLERLQEIGVWNELPAPRQDDVRTPPATLGEVEQALQGNEALLVFQLADWRDLHGRFAGGSWLFAVTRSGTRVHRLGDRRRLEAKVAELVDPENGTGATLAAELYRELLAPALDDLPAGVDELLIVPDGRLHRLPFDRLGPVGGEPMALRYRISLLPSADFWLRWGRRGAGAGPALVLADPARPAQPPAEGEAGDKRGDDLGAGARWCRQLPYAREEGRAIAAQAGGSSVLRLGEEASEHFLKRADLRPFGVIHVASHALVDERHGEKSLVCLAAGGAGEDGDLRAQEIVQLRLSGQLVVLASCDSAGGPQLAGEGVMSLARAFFLAGARTVVASLRSIDDAEARDLFVRFHGHLAAGRSVAAALQAAKREIWAEHGAAAASVHSAWANVVVLGDGSQKPLLTRRSSWLAWVGAILAIYLISVGVRVWRQRR